MVSDGVSDSNSEARGIGDEDLQHSPAGAVAASPGPLRAWLQRRRLVAYYLLSLLSVMALIALTFRALVSDVVPNLIVFVANLGMPVNVVGIGLFAARRPAALLVLAFVVAPTVAALVVAALADGRRGVFALLGRLKPWGREADPARALRAYTILLVGYVACIALYVFVAWRSHGSAVVDQMFASLAAIGVGTVAGLLVSPFLDEGGLFQELGWRGYALPLLLTRRGRSPLGASLILALLWWSWYLPREFSGMAFGTPLTGIIQAVLPFLVYLIGLSILITYFWFQTGGSVLPAIWIHGGANALGRIFGDPVNQWAGTDMRTWLIAALAMALLALVGPDLGKPATEGESSSAEIDPTRPQAYDLAHASTGATQEA